jgi:Ca-activated chloride channel homolog
MSFSAPLALASLLVVPLLLGAYLWQLRRRRKHAVRFSNVSLVRAAIPARSRWRRHVPVALFLAALASLALATARPEVSQAVPIGRTSIILALDVSRSMCANDVRPNRITVAQQAAKNFVKGQVPGTRIGLVAFAGFPELVVPPTTDKGKLTDAINNLTTARGTVIGAAELEALNAIAAVNPDVAPVGTDAGTGDAPPPATPPAADSDYQPDIIVLLTDGANTRGISPVDAAQYAAQRKVRVYTIGFGTTNPTSIVCTSQQLGGDVFGEGQAFPGGGGGFPGGGGGRSFLTIDEDTLRKVADATGGQFYRAQDADQLTKVFQDLPRTVVVQHEQREITVIFAAAGLVLALAAIGLSLLWNKGT